MSRPAKPIQATSYAMTKTDRKARTETESKLRGDKAVKVPPYLSPGQKKIAKAIIDGLSNADILSSLDDTIIAMAAFSIEGIQQCIREQQEERLTETDRSDIIDDNKTI